MFLSYTCCTPTGCDASLINETPHHQLFNIPTGSNFRMIPKDWGKK